MQGEEKPGDEAEGEDLPFVRVAGQLEVEAAARIAGDRGLVREEEGEPPVGTLRAR